jgi:chromosomal replication initiation ATPase DnaA
MSRRAARPQSAQLPLDLALNPMFGREDFLVGPSNEQAYSLIDLWPDWPDRILLLVGPEGSGKSHLAAIWAAQAKARVLSGRSLDHADPPALAAAGAIVLEDMDRGAVHERPMFHLLNLARETSAFLLATARTGPEHWGIDTPDLLSRLRLAPRMEIGPPDDALLRAVIVKQFLDRQIVVDTSVVEYLLSRIERSFAAAQRAVETLDKAALAERRRITRQFAAGVLEKARADGE